MSTKFKTTALRAFAAAAAFTLALASFAPAAYAAEGLPDPVEGVVTLTENTTVGEKLTVSENLTINLAGHKLSYTPDASIEVKDGGSLTIKNGKFYASGLMLTRGALNVQTGSSLYIEGVELASKGAGVFPQGDAARVTIVDSQIYSDSFALGTNAATSENHNVEISLEDSKFISTKSAYPGDACAAYVNVPCDLTIDGCEFNGTRQALLIRGGKAAVTNSTIRLTDTTAYVPQGIGLVGSPLYGDKEAKLDGAWGGGNDAPMAAVVIGNREGSGASYRYPTDVYMSGVEVVAPEGYTTVYAYGESGHDSVALIYDSNCSLGTVVNGEGSVAVTGPAVAETDGAVFRSLGEAVEAAKAGSTVKLLEDVVLDSTLNIHNKDIVLDLNGHKISAAEGFSSVAINVGASGDASKASKVVLTDSSAEKTGEIDIAASKAAICVRVSSEMTISNARIVYTGTKKGNDGSLSNNPAIQNQGKLTLNSGASVTSNTSGATVFGLNAVFEMNDGASIVADAMQALSGNGSHNGTSITINGGSIESKKSAGIYHPQEGVLTLNGGLITGDVGVQVCGGELVVPENSTVVVAATGSDRRPDKKSDDGDIPDGAALSLINRDGYPAGTPVANVAGGTFTSKQGDSVLAYAWSKDGESSEWMAAADSVDIVGGIYSKEFDKSLLGKDFALHADGDKYTVVKASGQAEGEDVSGAITVKPSHPALKPSIKPAVGDKLAESVVAAGESLLKGDGVQGMSVNNEEGLRKVAARVDEAKGDTLETTLSFNLSLLESAPKDEAEIIDQKTAAGEKASYLDISVVLNVAAVDKDGKTIASASSGVTELDEPLEIMVSVLDADLTGSVRLARVHEGTFEFIPCTVNAGAGTITFTTDRFSTYVLLTSNSVEVTFESNGGSAVEKQTVKYGEKVTKPADPTRDGFTFDAWYSDKELTKVFDFNKALDPKTDEPAMTLFAKWTEVEKPGPKPEQPVMRKVTFVPIVGGEEKIVREVEDGKFVDLPKTPVCEGYTFAGWFFDKDFKKPFKAEENAITADLTLYGGWYENNSKEPITPQKPSKPAPKPELPQTGDDSMIPIVVLGLGGFAVIAAGVVLSRKNKK